MKPLCKAEIAKRLGISKPSVTLLLQAPDAPAPVGKGRYDIAAVKAFWKSRKALDKAKPTGTYAEELKAKTAAQRALLELELEVKRGNLIDKDTVERDQRAFVQIVTNDLLTCHGTIAHLCVGKTHAEAETAVKAHIRRMLEGWQKLA